MGGYPSTNIEWVNNSAQSNVPPIGSIREKAIMMTVCSSDKGYEDFRIVDSNYAKIYGKVSFAKHGQPQIQAAAILDAGASIYNARIVAKDSTLAHIGLDVTVSKTETQKKNAEGALLYKDADGAETTEADGNTPIMVTGATLKFGTAKIEEATLKTAGNHPKEIAKAIKATYTDWATADMGTVDSIKFPIMVLTETGRGKSKKKIRITPDYSSSKSANWTKYNMSVLEDNQSVDNVIMFSMNPAVIDVSSGNNYENRFIDTVISKRSEQLRCVAFEDCVERMYEYISIITKKTVDSLKGDDILFACTRKGYPLDGVVIDATGISLNNLMGIDLLGGSNGALGDYPIESAEYEALMVEAFNGTLSPDIYDINNRRINAIFDANYPAAVKRVIEGLVSFREDIFYFRDLGTELHSVEEIIQADVLSLKSKFCASYHNCYDVYEPSTRKQITVTCMYDLVARFIGHEISGVNRPFAGLLYGITFTDGHIVPDTFNFIPRKIPGYDQIEALNDAKINYIVKYNDVPTMDTQWTSDDLDSDFSSINNILEIQRIIRAIRTRCPKTRYAFKTANDYESYKKDVDSVLNAFKSNFTSLTLEFLADEEQKDSKAVYAVISVACKDFIDKEYFKIVAI